MLKRHLFIVIASLLFLVACGGQPTVSQPMEVQMSDLDRAVSLLDGFELEERPLSIPLESIQAKAGTRFVTADEQVDILIFELESGGDFTNAVSKLVAEGIDVAAEAPLSYAGANGTILFVVRNVAAPQQQEETRWVVSAIAGALAGEE